MKPSRSWRRYQLSSGSRMIGSSGSPAAIRAVISAHLGGDEVLVQHRNHRQINSHHRADLPAPGTCRVDDVLAPDRVAAGMDHPCARGGAFNPLHRLMTPDLGAPRTRARGQRMRGERRIHVPVIRLVDRTEQAVHSHQRIDPGQLLGGEDPEFMADELSEPLHVTKLRHPLGRTGDAQCSARMEAGRLTGLGRQHVAVQTHRGRAHLHDGGVVGEVGAEPGRVPGRARGQLALLQEHDVAPAAPGQVVGERDAHDAAAHDHYLGIGCH